MELPLTPLEFARRARKLYGNKEAVIDGELRLTYEAFFDRCDRWSSALQNLGVKKGDRVATIAPNTHAQLESFYAIPQLGAVVVPLNYRLIADDFAYMIQHSGARVVCAHPDYLDAVDSIRAQIPGVECFVAYEGARDKWLEYEKLIASVSPRFERPSIEERDLLTINYTSGTRHVRREWITHRNAWANSSDAVNQPMNSGRSLHRDVPSSTPTAGPSSGPSQQSAERMSVARVEPTQSSSGRATRDHDVCAAPTVGSIAHLHPRSGRMRRGD